MACLDSGAVAIRGIVCGWAAKEITNTRANVYAMNEYIKNAVPHGLG
jgi:hypothetical protein